MKIIDVTLNDKGKIVNCDFVAWIMNEIEDKAFTRNDVAHTYAILIQKGHQEWRSINEAILKRWSPAGLRWIKEQAWKQVNAEARS